MADEITMNMFGDLEEVGDEEGRMVVRILGHRIGTSLGWLHVGGHTVIMPEFKREPGLLHFMPDRDIPNQAGVIVDYYAGLMGIIEEPTQKVHELSDLKLVWSTKLAGKT